MLAALAKVPKKVRIGDEYGIKCRKQKRANIWRLRNWLISVGFVLVVMLGGLPVGSATQSYDDAEACKLSDGQALQYNVSPEGCNFSERGCLLIRAPTTEVFLGNFIP